MTESTQIDDYKFKIILVGDSGTGKTSLFERFIYDRINFDSRTTIGIEFASKRIQIKGKTVCTQIWDTLGQERFNAISKRYYRGSVGAFVVFDLTRKETFENTVKWIQELKDNTENIVIMLIGNKCDLVQYKEEPFEFAQRYNITYMETSALTAENVVPAFEKCIEEIMEICKGTDETNNTKGMSIEEKPNVQSSGGCCG